VLNTEFFDHREHLEQVCDTIVYTGPIDTYFSDKGLDQLEYRSTIFTEERHFNHPGHVLPQPVVTYPGLETDYTRAVEYKQFLHQPSPHTILIKETISSEGGDPQYPVPTVRNQKLYETYKELADGLENGGRIRFVGGGADYEYYTMDQTIDNALTEFYKSSPLPETTTSDSDTASNTGTNTNTTIITTPMARHDTKSFPLHSTFMTNEFQAYKTTIQNAITTTYPPQNRHTLLQEGCKPHLWIGEFGMELRFMTPWAYYLRERCGGVATEGATGTKYLYFFSNNHTIDNTIQRVGRALPDDNPFMAHNSVHDSTFDATFWRAPPYAEFFRRRELEGILQPGKPLVVILNKYTVEWEKEPANFFPVETLRRTLDYLTPKYTVLYKRHTSSALQDHQDQVQGYEDKEMIRNEYKRDDVLFFEEFADCLEDVDDVNLLLFGLMSLSKRFLTVQGGTAVTGSYFGGTNVILIKKGNELVYGDYGYFHRFSNATVVQTETDESFLNAMEAHM